MKRIWIVTAFFFLLAGLLMGEDRTKLQQEYDTLKKKRQDLETSYWEKKYKYLQNRQNGKNELDKIYAEISHLLSKKNLLQDRIMTLKNDIASASEKKDSLAHRKRQILEIYEKLHEKLSVIVKNHAPFTSAKDQITLDEIKRNVDQGEKILSTATSFLDLINNIRHRARQISLYKENILTEKGQPLAGYKLRMGTVFWGYRTDSGIEGILGRNGKITGKIYTWFEDIPPTGMSRLISIKEQNENTKVVGLYMDVLQSPASGKVLTRGKSYFTDFVTWFKSGKTVMYVLLIIFLLVFVILIERLIFYFIRLDFSLDFSNKYLGRFASKFLTRRRPLVIMESEVRNRSQGNYEKAEGILEECLIKEFISLEKNLNTLKTMAALAPLLGLLGTVTGMISLFEVITAFGTGDPKILAGGISEALVTTEFGLIIAIPSMFFFRILKNRADHCISLLETRGLEILNTIKDSNNINNSNNMNHINNFKAQEN